jgi:hypothetical protein
MRLTTWTIGAKIAAGTGALTLALALTAGLGLRTVGSVGAAFDNTANSTARKIELAAVINKSDSDMAVGHRGVVLGAYAKNPAYAAAARQVFQESSTKLKHALADMQPLLTTEEGRQATARIESELAQWLAAFSEIERLPAMPTGPQEWWRRRLLPCIRPWAKTPRNWPHCSEPRSTPTWRPPGRSSPRLAP